MAENNELFPFPESSDAETINSEGNLPAFPESDEPPLTNEELKAVRTILKENLDAKIEKIDNAANVESLSKIALDTKAALNTGAIGIRAEAESSTENFASTGVISRHGKSLKTPTDGFSTDMFAMSTSDSVVVASLDLKQELLECWHNLPLNEPTEIEVRKQLVEVIGSIPENNIFVHLWGALTSIFHLKSSFRHGTPDQKLFALMASGERFLNSIAGITFPDRRRLLKIVARYFSGISEEHSFISMEGEIFNPQYHERASGSSSSGRHIREMRSFLVTTHDNQVIKVALVMT